MAGCRGASSCQVRCQCQRVSSRLIVLQCMYIHVPRSLCTVGRWERTCEDCWKLEVPRPPTLMYSTVVQLPACFRGQRIACVFLSKETYLTTVHSVVPVSPCRALHLLLLAFRARYTTGPQYPETSRKSHELHASSSSDEPEPRDKTALSMLVPLPSLFAPRRVDYRPVALRRTIFPRCRARVA
jgi:hypothetical protein